MWSLVLSVCQDFVVWLSCSVYVALRWQCLRLVAFLELMENTNSLLWWWKTYGAHEHLVRKFNTKILPVFYIAITIVNHILKAKCFSIVHWFVCLYVISFEETRQLNGHKFDRFVYEVYNDYSVNIIGYFNKNMLDLFLYLAQIWFTYSRNTEKCVEASVSRQLKS